MSDFGKPYIQTIEAVNKELRVDESFDIVTKRIKIGNVNTVFYCINGFIKDEMFESMLEYLTRITDKQMKEISTADEFIDRYITYVETNTESKIESFVTKILSGAIGMIVEGYDKGIIIDSRTYPVRAITEPESDKVLRGSHEGFVETVIFNTALIRRKIRNPKLTIKSFKIGEESKTDVVICYLDDIVDKKQLKILTKKLSQIKVKSLAMGQESLRECLLPDQPWNPFPKVRYTERPDTASACIYDGNIIVISDGSPSAMIIPTGIFDFVQDINDYYFPPMVGTFLRVIRCVVFFLSLMLVPTWYMLTLYGERLPEWLKFIEVLEPNEIPLIYQLIAIEFVVDTLKLASLNTPSALSNSFSVVGALVLGEFAVQTGWFVSEVLLFMAFSAISNFTQPSYELGYAIKISRVIILVLTAVFKFWGYLAGVLIVALVVCTTKTIGGYTYLYPLFPFDWEKLSGLLVRKHIKFRYEENR